MQGKDINPKSQFGSYGIEERDFSPPIPSEFMSSKLAPNKYAGLLRVLHCCQTCRQRFQILEASTRAAHSRLRHPNFTSRQADVRRRATPCDSARSVAAPSPSPPSLRERLPSRPRQSSRAHGRTEPRTLDAGRSSRTAGVRTRAPPVGLRSVPFVGVHPAPRFWRDSRARRRSLRWLRGAFTVTDRGGAARGATIHLRASSCPRARLLSSGRTCRERGPARLHCQRRWGVSTSSGARIHCFVSSRRFNQSARKLKKASYWKGTLFGWLGITSAGHGYIITNFKCTSRQCLFRILFSFSFYDLDRNVYIQTKIDRQIGRQVGISVYIHIDIDAKAILSYARNVQESAK